MQRSVDEKVQCLFVFAIFVKGRLAMTKCNVRSLDVVINIEKERKMPSDVFALKLGGSASLSWRGLESSSEQRQEQPSHRA
jgi:hypothetical protein